MSIGAPTCWIAAVVHHDDPVGQRHRLGLVVGDHDHRRVDPLLQLRELDPGAQPQRRVEVGQRLVEQEQLGLLDERAADRDALALAARQLRRACGRAAARSRAPAPHRRCARSISSARNARVAEPERHVLADGHVRVERVMLEDHGDAALAGRQRSMRSPSSQTSPASAVSRPAMMRSKVDLPRTRRTEEGDELARLEAQRNVVEHRRRAKGFADADQLQARHAALPQRGTLTSTLPRGNGCRGGRPAEREKSLSSTPAAGGAEGNRTPDLCSAIA